MSSDSRRVDPATNGSGSRIFISYCHKDKKFLDELLTHLSPLERAGRVSAWSDRQLEPGAPWLGKIQEALDSSSVVVMLVTSSFLASEFIHQYELTPALRAAKARILWVPVRACAYERTALRDIQAVVSPAKPLAEMKAERDRAWVEICRAIEDAAEGGAADAASGSP